MADTDSSGSRQDREQAELRTAGIEQSPGDSGLSRTGKDEQVKGGGYELNEPRPMADTECVRTQVQNARKQSTEQWADGNIEKIPYPLYPPGPGDRDGWDRLLREYPDLAPTFCKEGHDVQPEVQKTQSCIRRTSDGPLPGVDLRLRAVGNGVVPAVSALAFRTLARELKIEGLLYEQA